MGFSQVSNSKPNRIRSFTVLTELNWKLRKWSDILFAVCVAAGDGFMETWATSLIDASVSSSIVLHCPYCC